MSNPEKNIITERLFISVTFHLDSPLCIGSNDSTLTDLDVIRHSDSTPFIPGTSIAGALRSYLNTTDSEDLFGYTEGKKGLLSPLTISDAEFDNPESIRTYIRDGVALNEKKQTIDGAKFDMEVLPPGIKGNCDLELVIRQEKITSDKAIACLKEILIGVATSEIAFGHKKNRGYGKISIDKIHKKLFKMADLKDNDNKEAYFNFLKTKTYTDNDSWEFADSIKKAKKNSKYECFEIPLELNAGISIREYSTLANEADFSHIQIDGKSVIPGTSWTGALRHQMHRILSKDLKITENATLDLLAEIFGSKKDNTLQTSQTFFSLGAKKHVSKEWASNMRIREGIIDNAKTINLTRTSINRFTGGASNQSLYTETVSVGGTTTLVIQLKKDEQTEQTPDWRKGLLYLAIQDLCNGYLMIGGETSIGRGWFKLDSNRASSIDTLFENKNTYLLALAKRISSIKENQGGKNE